MKHPSHPPYGTFGADPSSQAIRIKAPHFRLRRVLGVASLLCIALMQVDAQMEPPVVFKVPVNVKMMGMWQQGWLFYQGETTITHRQVSSYLKSKEKRSGYGGYPRPSQGSGPYAHGAYPSSGLLIVKAIFKHRGVTPGMPTEDVHVKVFFGEEAEYPSLQAVVPKMNPYNGDEMEILDPSFSSGDMKKVRVEVWIANAPPELQMQLHGAAFQLGLGLSNYMPPDDMR